MAGDGSCIAHNAYFMELHTWQQEKRENRKEIDRTT